MSPGKALLILSLPFLLSHLYIESFLTDESIQTIQNDFVVLPNDWTEYHLTHKERQSPHTFHILLRHNPDSVSNLEQLLLNVSNPNHEQYGNYLTKDEINKILELIEAKHK